MFTANRLRPVAALVALIVVFLLLRAQFERGGAENAPPLVSVFVAEPQTLHAALVLAGTLVPRNEVMLAAQSSGTIATVNADIGEPVKQGQVLAMLDTTTLAANVAGAKARVAAATANAAAAARAYGRVAGIGSTGAMSPEQIDQRAADAAAQEAQIGAARADLAVAEAALKNAAIVTPMDGVIAARNAEPGQLVGPGGPPLFTLIGDSGVIFRASATQDQIALLKPGMTATLALPDGSVTGTVREIDPSIDATTHLGTVRIALPDASGLIPGSFLEARIDLGARTTLAVPRSALVAGDDGFHVVAVAHGKAVLRPVTLAPFPGNSSGLVPLGGGIANGETIVTQAGASLYDGEAVRTSP